MAAQFLISFPAQLDYFKESQTAVSQFAREQGFSPARISEIELAVEEALINIVHYAYKGMDGEVTLECKLTPEKGMVIEISDTGIPFNPLTKEDPDITLSVSERTIGGLGVYLIKQLMDEVHYRREGDKNILTLWVYKKPL